MANPERREPDTLKLEHLAEGIRPIMACVGTKAQYGEEISQIKDIEKVGLNVDFLSGDEKLAELNFKNSGPQSYVISGIDSKPKFTEQLFNCTSIAAVGREAGSDVELSFLTHQNPKEFLGSARDSFVKDLKDRLEELKNKCSEESVDVVISGGHFHADDAPEYQESLNMLSSAVREALGFKPLVISSPKNRGADSVYFDTASRKLFVVRPYSARYNDVFKPEEVDKLKKKWEKENKKDIL